MESQRGPLIPIGIIPHAQALRGVVGSLFNLPGGEVCSIDAIMKKLHEHGYTGPMRPDHGRMIWDEKGTPGYGLYDRALGLMYLQGLWEAITKDSEQI